MPTFTLYLYVKWYEVRFEAELFDTATNLLKKYTNVALCLFSPGSSMCVAYYYCFKLRAWHKLWISSYWLLKLSPSAWRRQVKTHLFKKNNSICYMLHFDSEPQVVPHRLATCLRCPLRPLRAPEEHSACHWLRSLLITALVSLPRDTSTLMTTRHSLGQQLHVNTKGAKGVMMMLWGW